jgi:aldehyde:ferredoxin oxidoreductase
MFGYAGKILRVSLTDEKASEEPLNESTARKFIGGRGLGVKILFDELKRGIDPLGPDNKIVIATGVLTGIPIPGNARHIVMAKSPLTGIWGESSAGGFFGQELKSAGYDAIIIEGRAAKPVYLWLHDGETEVRDASDLWGKLTRDVQRDIIKEVKDDRAVVACIGPAGENLVKFASVFFDFNHVAGRTGMGAVMGSKKLKAIVIRGKQKLKYSNEQKLIDLSLKELANKGENARRGPYWPDALDKYGSNADFIYWQLSGRLPTQNFRMCTFFGHKNLMAETVSATILIRTNTCPYCPIPCNRIVQVHEPYEVDPDYCGPEYETTAALGSFCMNDNLAALAKANELCNKYAMDTISTGVTIAFAMECYEKGLITMKDTEGLDLSWGNPEAIVQLTEKIARRQGIGDLLAEGVRIAAKKIGRGAEEFAMHIKGQEMPMHEGRGKKGHGLSFAISNRGACHLQMESDDLFEETKYPEIGIDETVKADRLYTGPEKVKLVKIVNDLFILYDCLPICRWTVYPCGGRRLEAFAGIINAATGWDVTIGELMTVGERVCNLERVFNIREGITRKDDLLPKRLMEEPLPDGPYKGEVLSKDVLDKMLDYWYELRGWDNKTGIPTREKLEELGLEHAMRQLEQQGLL